MKQLIVVATTVFVSISVMAKDSARYSPSTARSRANTREALMVELTGKDLSKVSDKELYGEIYGAFQKDDEIALKSRLQSLLSRFPQSEYADNALYLAGLMAMNHKGYAEALQYFSKIEQNYPRGNKLVSARFAKAMTYKKMNLDTMAKDVLKDVKKKYPGSPESFRAETEIKLIK